MFPNPATFRRNVLLLVAAACLVRLAIGIVSWRTISNLTETYRQVQRTQEVLGALEAARSSLEGAIAAERGYLITGRPSDLALFAKAERATRQRLSILGALVLNETSQYTRVAVLANLINKRFELADAVLNERRASGFEAVRARVSAGMGSAEFEAAMAQIGEARAEELSRLGARMRVQERETTRALKGIALAAVASMLVIVAVALWLLPAFDERVAVRDALMPKW